MHQRLSELEANLGVYQQPSYDMNMATSYPICCISQPCYWGYPGWNQNPGYLTPDSCCRCPLCATAATPSGYLPPSPPYLPASPSIQNQFAYPVPSSPVFPGGFGYYYPYLDPNWTVPQTPSPMSDRNFEAFTFPTGISSPQMSEPYPGAVESEYENQLWQLDSFQTTTSAFHSSQRKCYRKERREVLRKCSKKQDRFQAVKPADSVISSSGSANKAREPEVEKKVEDLTVSLRGLLQVKSEATARDEMSPSLCDENHTAITRSTQVCVDDLVGSPAEWQSPASSQEKKCNAGEKVAYCRFCKSNGESVQIYSSHVLKDGSGNTVCPILIKHVCTTCGKTGAQAHTMKYCPERKFGSDTPVHQYRRVRNSVGKLCVLKY